MSAMIDSPQENKMVDSAPAKKQFHFAATAEHFAEAVYAHTIEEATEIYHKVKKAINPVQATPAVAKPDLNSTAGAASSDIQKSTASESGKDNEQK